MFLRRVLLYLLLLVISLVLLTIAVPVLIYYAFDVFFFRVWNHGRVYLVYTRRHGWNEFVANNLLPVLGNVDLIAKPRGGRSSWPRTTRLVTVFGVPKPYFVHVRWYGLRASSLHDLLLPLKSFGARSEEVQRTLRELQFTKLSSRSTVT
jgi:hypothetical protein